MGYLGSIRSRMVLSSNTSEELAGRGGLGRMRPAVMRMSTLIYSDGWEAPGWTHKLSFDFPVEDPKCLGGEKRNI